MSVLDRDGDFNFGILTPLPAVFAVLIIVNDLDRGSFDVATIVICSVIASVYAIAFVLILAEQAAEDRFRRWLCSSIAEIEAGQAKYGATPIMGDTELRRFDLAISMVFLHFVVPLRPRVAGEGYRGIARLSAVISLLAGVWFWSAIVRAPVLAFANLRGGTRITVAQYHAELVANGTAGRLQRQAGDPR